MGSTFWSQPIDVVLNQILVSFGWIPIAIVLLWGFVQMWQNYRQGLYVSSLRWIILAIDVPPMTEQTPKALENLFTGLYGAYSTLTWKEKWIIGKVQPVFCFEISSTEGYIQFYVRTQVRFRDQIEAGIYAQYPEAEITEAEDYISWVPEEFPDEEWDIWGSEIEQKKDSIFPIRTYVDFEDKLTGEIKDPLGQILEGMAKMKPGEHYAMQLLISPNGNDWKKPGVDFINKTFGVEEKHKPGMIGGAINAAIAIPSAVIAEATGVGISDMIAGGHGEMTDADIWKAFKLTTLEKEQAEGVLHKIGKVGMQMKIRMLYVAKKGVYDKNARTAFVKGMLAQFTHLNLNYLGLYVPTTPKDDYFWQRWVYTGKQHRLVKAFKGRSWGLGRTPGWMNVEEFASLWHFPAVGAKAPLVKRAEARRAEPPSGLPITHEEYELPKGPPKSSAPSVPSASSAPYGSLASHGGHRAEPGEIDFALPGIEIEEPLLPHPTAPIELPSSDEVEPGLDATDMGPPADVILPGPPPGWKE